MTTTIYRPITHPKRRKSLMQVEIEAHLDCLQLNPADRESLLALAQIYLREATTGEHRTLIRATIADNEDTIITVETLYWDLIDNGIDLPALERLRLGLALIAMSDGQPNMRDARRALMLLVSRARDTGIIPKDHVLAVQATASARTAPIFEKRWRRDDRQFSRFILQNLALDLMLGAGVVLAQGIPAEMRTGVILLLMLVIGIAHGTLLLRYIREN